MRTVRIVTGYEDGSYWWRHPLPGDPEDEIIEVPEDLVLLWEAHAKMDSAIQDQLRRLDTEVWERKP